MQISHELLVLLAKSLGLIWLMAMFLSVLVYCWWPGSKARFNRAAESILDVEDSA